MRSAGSLLGPMPWLTRISTPSAGSAFHSPTSPSNGNRAPGAGGCAPAKLTAAAPRTANAARLARAGALTP